MSAKQFMEWKIYSQLEPFDEFRADLRTAHIVQALYNIYRDQKKHPSAYSILDIVLPSEDENRTRAPKKDVDWRVMKSAAMMWALVKEGHA
jgi:hypothetical protein